MSVQDEAKSNDKTAVFCRNYGNHLEEAVSVGESHPARRIVFRSRKKWVSVRHALDAHGPRRIYFAVIDDSAEIKFTARLDDVILSPSLDDPETQRALEEYQIKGTEGEGTWQNEVETLYLISNCQPVESFPFTDLNKLNDGEPLDENYRHSYALVQARNL